jgi:hypothetical protein
MHRTGVRRASNGQPAGMANRVAMSEDAHSGSGRPRIHGPGTRGNGREFLLPLCDALTRIEHANGRSDSSPFHDDREAPGEQPWMRLKARLNAASVA